MILNVSNKNKKKLKVIWAVFGISFGSVIGAILGIIAYNNHWLG